ncbi:hypothetical protein [Marivivens marinus]|uniref:hypothetical protein n=1 Tax=Marivivens marinus TaxID=3110173 RepID=UPI003B847E13
MNNYFKSVALAATVVATGASAEISETCKATLADRSSTIIVPNAPGGGYDTYARAIAPAMADASGLRVRVVNNEAGGGLVARRLMLQAGSDDIVILMENAVDLTVDTVASDSEDTILSVVDTLAIAHVAPDAWILPVGRDITDLSMTHLVAAQGSLEDSVIAVVLVGLALGIETEVVGGYGGSSEFVAAVLRGEVDMTSISLQTSLRRTEGNDAFVALVVSDAYDAAAPDVPYLAGPGGVAEMRAAGLSAEVQAERQAYAEAAVGLSGAVRGFYVSNSVDSEFRDCLRDAMEVAMTSPEVAETLEAQGRPLAPLTGSAATNKAAAMLRAAASGRALIEQIMADQED